ARYSLEGLLRRINLAPDRRAKKSNSVILQAVSLCVLRHCLFTMTLPLVPCRTHGLQQKRQYAGLKRLPVLPDPCFLKKRVPSQLLQRRTLLQNTLGKNSLVFRLGLMFLQNRGIDSFERGLHLRWQIGVLRQLFIRQSVACFQYSSELLISNLVTLCFEPIEKGIYPDDCLCKFTIYSRFSSEKCVRRGATFWLRNVFYEMSWKPGASQCKPTPDSPVARNQGFKVGGLFRLL